jgi:hypothetical protein
VQEIREYESFSQTNKYNRKEAEFRQRADRGKLTTGWVCLALFLRRPRR